MIEDPSRGTLLRGEPSPGSAVRDGAEKWEVQLRKGSLELAILASLWDGRLYGLEILRRLESDSELIVSEGTVYPLLSRLKSLKLVDSEWVESDGGHPRKYYRLTEAGKQWSLAMSRVWHEFSASMTKLLTPLTNERAGKEK
ncbi:MAG TPA: PadR family transcriptional regulator [Terriglobales bacterium]|nr:PadR family transcriptional regulator [Terriglobales bacterium]